jgi:hypothetical protein
MSIISAGTTTTTALSSTGNTDGTLQFQVNGTTASVTLNTLGAIGVGSSPSFGTSGQVLTSAGSTAAPAWATPSAVNLATGVTGTLPISNGGTGTTSTTFANLTTNVTGTLPIANGGTNSTATPTAGTIPYGTGTALAYTSAGSSGQLLQSNGASAPSWVAAPATNPAGSTGQVQYNNAGAFGAISSGTSGQILTSAGAGAAPAWADPAAGGSLILLQTVTGSSVANLDVTGSFSSTYKFYKLYFISTATTAGLMEMRLYINGTIATTGYASSGLQAELGSALTTYSTGSNTVSLNRTKRNFAIELTFCDPSNTVSRFPFYYNATGVSDGNPLTCATAFGWGANTNQGSSGQRAMTGIRFLFDGTMDTATARLYGIKE